MVTEARPQEDPEEDAGKKRRKVIERIQQRIYLEQRSHRIPFPGSWIWERMMMMKEVQ